MRQGVELYICYFMYLEDRETHQCYPSYKTIGEALGIDSTTTVSKYVKELEDKQLIYTEPTQVTTFKFTKPDVVYAKWERNGNEIICPNEEIMSKDICCLTDEETKLRTKIIVRDMLSAFLKRNVWFF